MNSTTLTLTNDTGPPPAKKKTLGSILKKNKEAMFPKTPQDRVKAEIDAYLSLPVVDSESDPLYWWRTQYNSYPILAQLAKKYLCICASSAASERLFSTSGNIVSLKRSCLTLKPAQNFSEMHVYTIWACMGGVKDLW